MISLVRRMFMLFDHPTRWRFVLAVAGMVFIGLAEIASVLAVIPLMQLTTGASTESGALGWINDILGNPSSQWLAAAIAGVVFGGFLFKGLASLGIRWWTLGLINRHGARTSSDLLRYYLSAPISLHVRRGTADLVRVMHDAVSQVYFTGLSGVMQALTELITVTALALTLLVVAPEITIGVTCYFLVIGWTLQRLVKRRSRQVGQRTIHSAHFTTRTALHALGGIKEIKLRNEQDLVVAGYERARQDNAEAVRATSFYSDLPKYTMEIVFILGIGLMTVAIYAQEPTDGALALLALFAVAGYRVMPSSVRMLAALNQVRVSEASLDLVESDLRAARALGSGARPPAGPVTLDQALEVEDLRFRYDDGDRDVLHGVSLKIPAGSSLALVGGSGAGKSTLVDVLLGLQTPTDGRLLADGIPIADREGAWRELVAMVPQDVYLLEGTIAENIVFSPDTVPEPERLRTVVSQSQLDEVLDELPEGWDTPVGERGGRLSGGQRQRIGIARALYRAPRLLVLDEATSALDNETEHEITQTMQALHGQITTVVVAHRLSTVRHCDQIAFLEHGAITGLGSFEELRRTSPRFARLVELGSLESPATDQS